MIKRFAYAQSYIDNIQSDLLNLARALNFAFSLYLCPYSVCQSREGSDKTAHMRSPARAFPAMIAYAISTVAHLFHWKARGVGAMFLS